MASNIELKQISDTEYWIGASKTTLIENNIIYVIAEGEQFTEIAQMHLEGIKRLRKLVVGKISYLINLNNCGKNSHEARKIWKKLSEDQETEKVALFGLHPVAKIIASFVMNVSTKKQMKFFQTKEDALAWLNES